MKRLIWITVLVGLLLSAITPTAWAQSTAQINGKVTDRSGAVLPGVEVTVTQVDTRLERKVVSNETGSYTLTNLPVGPYRLEAALPGFRTYAQTGIVLQVGGNPVINIVLEVGAVAETVEVQADAALVETRSTGVGQVIDNVRIMEKLSLSIGRPLHHLSLGHEEALHQSVESEPAETIRNELAGHRKLHGQQRDSHDVPV